MSSFRNSAGTGEVKGAAAEGSAAFPSAGALGRRRISGGLSQFLRRAVSGRYSFGVVMNQFIC